MSREWDDPNQWENVTGFCPACGKTDSIWRDMKPEYYGEGMDHLCSLCGCQFSFVATVAPEPISPKGYIEKFQALMAVLRLKVRG